MFARAATFVRDPSAAGAAGATVTRRELRENPILRDKFNRTSEQVRNDVLLVEAFSTRVQPTDRIEAVSS